MDKCHFLFRMNYSECVLEKQIVADKKSEFYGIVKKLNVENKNFLNRRETWGNRIAIDQHLKIHFKVYGDNHKWH